MGMMAGIDSPALSQTRQRGRPVSDERVKAIPEDLRVLHEWAQKMGSESDLGPMNTWKRCALQLIERIARSEQALAALEGRNAELKAALRRLIGACVRPNGMLQPPDVDSEYAARAALKGA